MKKFLKEIARFVCIAILISILVIASSYHAYTTAAFFCIGLGIILLLFISSIIQGKKKKISKVWAVDIGIATLLIYPIFLYLSGLFWSEEYKFMSLVMKYRDNTLLFLDEDTSNIKTYDYNDIKFSDDKKIAYDKEGNLLNGVVYHLEPSNNEIQSNVTEIYKAGRLIYWKFVNPNSGLVSIITYKDKNSISLLYFKQPDDGFMKNINSPNLNFVGLYNAINKPRLEYIIEGSPDATANRPWIKLYDREGKPVFEKDYITKFSTLCYLKDGTTRPASEEDIKNFFEQEVEVKKNTKYEFKSLCQ